MLVGAQECSPPPKPANQDLHECSQIDVSIVTLSNVYIPFFSDQRGGEDVDKALRFLVARRPRWPVYYDLKIMSCKNEYLSAETAVSVV